MSKIVWVNGVIQKQYEDLESIEKLVKSEKIDNMNLDRLITLLKEETKNRNKYDISYLISFYLGLQLGIGLLLIFATSLVDLGLYLLLLSFFHMWEYAYVSLYHPETLSYESFLLTHSPEFMGAMILSFSEYFIELYLAPWLKRNWFFYILFFLIAASGQALRTIAMHHAGKSFHHHIQEEKSEDHILVSDHVYAIWRHPSYFGWFLWSVATQFLLMNPISIIVFTYASWKFFSDRIPEEEMYLVRMFGEKYKDYCKRVPIRIPFIDNNLVQTY